MEARGGEGRGEGKRRGEERKGWEGGEGKGGKGRSMDAPFQIPECQGRCNINSGTVPSNFNYLH